MKTAHCAMSRLLLIAVLVVMLIMTVAQDPDKEKKDRDWKDFKETYGKKYKNGDEEKQRRGAFEENVKKIEQHNSVENKNYTEGINQFTDMTDEEFKANILVDFSKFINKNKDQVESGGRSRRQTAPLSKDWRITGCIGSVYDQGNSCGSCWAFAAVDTLEYYNCKKTGTLKLLSQQQLVDCAYASSGHDGCNGGFMTFAYDYVKSKGGITLSSLYPYQKRFGTCHSATPYGYCTGYELAYSAEGDELGLTAYVGLKGPVAAAIDANQLKDYKSGIFYSAHCSSYKINHAVTIVGYGTENGKAYWLIKNSWGTSWGENGYLRLARNQKNHCGIARYFVAPTV